MAAAQNILMRGW